MMPAYYIDANVLMYAAGADHPYREPCQEILTLVTEDRIDATISTEVLQEMLYHYFARDEREKGVRLCAEAMNVLPVLSVQREDMRAALSLCRSYPGLNSRDALHAAVVGNNRLSAIISTDQGFDQIRNLRRVDPADFPWKKR